MPIKKIILAPGRDKSVRHRHPWIFASAVDQVLGSPQPGETVVVASSSGEFLARASFSPSSQIRARVWSFDPGEEIDETFFRRRFGKALTLRSSAFNLADAGAYRLVHGESDGLPGLIVDRYGSYLVAQVLTAGMEYWREMVSRLLVELTGTPNLYERSDVDIRQLEGLAPRTGLISGQQPPQKILVRENGLVFNVDISAGQKTGFYLDQRANRQKLRGFAAGRNILNCFCYTGAFSVYGLAGGARSVHSIDSSADALAAGAENIAANKLDETKATWQQGDAFQLLREFRDRGRTFDAIILDPPKFAPTAAQAERAARGYKDINLLAFKMLSPGGVLFTFSCSGGISADLFQKIVAGAALDAGVEAVILEHMRQDADHPTALNFPEGAYLKGLVCAV